MAFWASLLAIALGLVAILGMEPNAMAIFGGLFELAAVIGVFGLICAAESRQ